jgi:hypothetical protein
LAVLTTDGIASYLMPSEGDDGLDPSAWERLRTVVTAANSGDLVRFEDEIRSWSSRSSLDEQHRIGLYLLAIVTYLVRLSLRGEPSRDDLKNIAVGCFPDVNEVLTCHPMAVEDALRIAFGMPAIRRELAPGEMVVLLAAITGSLLTEPEAELPPIREHVGEWWSVNARQFHDHGVQDR